MRNSCSTVHQMRGPAWRCLKGQFSGISESPDGPHQGLGGGFIGQNLEYTSIVFSLSRDCTIQWEVIILWARRTTCSCHTRSHILTRATFIKMTGFSANQGGSFDQISSTSIIGAGGQIRPQSGESGTSRNVRNGSAFGVSLQCSRHGNSLPTVARSGACRNGVGTALWTA